MPKRNIAPPQKETTNNAELTQPECVLTISSGSEIATYGKPEGKYRVSEYSCSVHGRRLLTAWLDNFPCFEVANRPSRNSAAICSNRLTCFDQLKSFARAFPANAILNLTSGSRAETSALANDSAENGAKYRAASPQTSV